MAGTKGVRLEPLSDPPRRQAEARESRPGRAVWAGPPGRRWQGQRGSRRCTRRLRYSDTCRSEPSLAFLRRHCACCHTRQHSYGGTLGVVQEHKVAALLHDVTGDVILAKPANPARFICDWMSALVGPEEADAQEASGGCFLRVHVECGLNGKRAREHFWRRAPEKGFKAGALREWRREASGVLATVVGSVLGDAQGNGRAAWKALDDEMRALEDRVREVEEELREARAELEKAGGVAAELRARLAEAAAGLTEDGNEDDASGEAAKGGWETTEELRGKLREVFDKMDLNKDGAVDAEGGGE
ncbi:hypothetical protein T484DRAFT_3648706 [Baffinella frigidus]|nr:hypothetical protein T484DRAFT_3648706 [Cryptophyta sp. CCMP2293]